MKEFRIDVAKYSAKRRKRIDKARYRMSKSVLDSGKASEEQGLGYKMLMSRLNESPRNVKHMRGGHMSAMSTVHE